MATITIRLPDDKHEQLKALAVSRKMSVNKLMEELSMIALTEFDAETRFRTLAKVDDLQAGIEILEQLDSHFS